MKWYLRITTKKGTMEFPYNGYKTKREALSQKELADKVPGTIQVLVIKK